RGARPSPCVPMPPPTPGLPADLIRGPLAAGTEAAGALGSAPGSRPGGSTGGGKAWGKQRGSEEFAPLNPEKYCPLPSRHLPPPPGLPADLIRGPLTADTEAAGALGSAPGSRPGGSAGGGKAWGNNEG